MRLTGLLSAWGRVPGLGLSRGLRLRGAVDLLRGRRNYLSERVSIRVVVDNIRDLGITIPCLVLVLGLGLIFWGWGNHVYTLLGNYSGAGQGLVPSRRRLGQGSHIPLVEIDDPV